MKDMLILTLSTPQSYAKYETTGDSDYLNDVFYPDGKMENWKVGTVLVLAGEGWSKEIIIKS